LMTEDVRKTCEAIKRKIAINDTASS